MKPAFALDLRNEAIALLHRTQGGWHQVGRVTFDEPDLAEALSYLRATALGLSPRGLATKLILPEDQILFTTVEAPGPDDAAREAQIRAALDGLTPYAVNELVFDWQVDGRMAHVAVIARETLAEAEAFATEHRFNPVSFVAPTAGGFGKEPWFGPTSLAPSLLADGEGVEPDDAQVTIIDRGLSVEAEDAVFDSAPEADASPLTEAVIEASDDPFAYADAAPESDRVEEAEPSVAAQDIGEAGWPDADADPLAEARPVADVEDASRFDTAAEVAEQAWPEAVEPEPVATASVSDFEGTAQSVAPEPTPEWRSQPPHRFDPAEEFEQPPPFNGREAEFEADTIPKVEAGFEPVADFAPAAEQTRFEPPTFETPIDAPSDPVEPVPVTPRSAPIFGLADDEQPPSSAFAGRGSSKASASTAFASNASLLDDLPEDLAAALQDIVLEEAPMAVDVEDEDAQPSVGAANPSASVTAPKIVDDVPPVPGFSPAMSFASRRASASDLGTGAPKVAAPVKPSIPRPVAARPLAPVAAPRADRPLVDRPTAVNPPSAKDSKGLRGLGALVTAPGLPGSRKKKAAAAASAAAQAEVKPAVAAQPIGATLQPSASPAKPERKGLGSGLSRPAPVRGKPKYLGLILTALLLLALAVIAAWSTSLAFRSNQDATTAIASATPPAEVVAAGGVQAADVPAPEDEMLADLQDPEEFAAAEAASQPAVTANSGVAAAGTTGANAVPTDTVASTDPVAAEGNTGNEIFLAAKDPAPTVPAAIDLPDVVAQGDPLPLAQAPPPPFGTVYQFDADGLIVPTPEGIVTPEGVRLVAGKPPVLPKARPEGLVPPVATVTQTPDATAVPADPALANARPKPRPEGLALPDDDAALPAAFPAADSRLAGLRPKARPQAIIAAGEAARSASAAASLAAQADAKAAEEAALAAAAPSSKLAVAISRKPQARPRDLSRAVEAAVAAAVRTPEPRPETTPEPEQKPEKTVKPDSAPKPTKLAAAPASPKDGEVEADAEPELASAPRVKQNASVAKQATFKNAINLSKTALIGVYGTPSKRYAMVRTEGGRYKKVKIGDSVDGGKVKAITASEVRYQKGSKLLTLTLPKG